MTSPPTRSSTVLIRDLLIFQLKLWLDGLKDLFLAPLSVIAAFLDLVFGPGRNGDRLYRVLKLGERYDLWLNLYGAAKAAQHSSEGLFAGSEPGDATLLGTLEGLGKRRGSADGSEIAR